MFDECSKRDDIKIEEARSNSDYDFVEYQLLDEISERDNINTEDEARSKSDDELVEYQLLDESSKRESINIITEAKSELDDLVEESVDLRETRQDSETLEELKVLERGDAGEVSEELGHNFGEEEEFIDDWEGIERTELEKRFGAATAFVSSRTNAGRISRLPNATKMRLHGLHKVAIEGPCLVPQPMALKVTARANWNAWQVLGNMTRETAMEQYIALMSSSVPAWIEDIEKIITF